MAKAKTKTVRPGAKSNSGKDDVAFPIEPASRRLSFLDLPAELRVKIYTHLFDGSVLALHDGKIDHSECRGSPEIILTCSTIHSEAKPILYSSVALAYRPNELNTTPTSHKALTPFQKSLIHSIELRNTYTRKRITEHSQRTASTCQFCGATTRCTPFDSRSTSCMLDFWAHGAFAFHRSHLTL
jgi:hypothetical protein